MTIRRWSGTLLGLVLISIYLTVYNIMNPDGTMQLVMLGLGVLLLVFAVYNSYKASDKEQTKRRVRKYKEDRDDVFDTSKYELLRETSREIMRVGDYGHSSNVSKIVQETFGKEEWDDVQTLLDYWKRKNNFKWDEKTLYDRLVVEADYVDGVVYSIRHDKHTKTFKIKGVLEKVKGDGIAYRISGVELRLKNVEEKSIGRNAEWEISAVENKSIYEGVLL